MRTVRPGLRRRGPQERPHPAARPRGMPPYGATLGRWKPTLSPSSMDAGPTGAGLSPCGQPAPRPASCPARRRSTHRPLRGHSGRTATNSPARRSGEGGPQSGREGPRHRDPLTRHPAITQRPSHQRTRQHDRQHRHPDCPRRTHHCRPADQQNRPCQPLAERRHVRDYDGAARSKSPAPTNPDTGSPATETGNSTPPFTRSPSPRSG